MKYLKMEDFVPHGKNLKNGESININHCKSGVDNARLYITRVNHNKLIAFCHHCGKRGIHTDNKPMSVEEVIEEGKKALDTNNRVLITSDLKLPPDITFNTKEWPVEAESWARKYEIFPSELVQHSISYSPSYRRVIIPIDTIKDKLLGFQTRRIFSDDTRPKYLTYKKEHSIIYKECITDTARNHNVCVLTEDVLSAIKCSRFYDSIAILGTKLSVPLVNHLTNYDTIIIFLDNDNDQVRENQLKLQRILLNVIKNEQVFICYGNKDPKQYKHIELREKLGQCLL